MNNIRKQKIRIWKTNVSPPPMRRGGSVRQMTDWRRGGNGSNKVIINHLPPIRQLAEGTPPVQEEKFRFSELKKL